VDFDLSPDQREIKDVARELLSARSPFAKVREAAQAGAYDPALWGELVELGWPGIAVAQEHGGQGLGAVELAVLVEELGYACAATPFLSTATAAAVIQAAGSDEQRARWLPGLVSGELTAGIGTRELAADGGGAAVVVVIDGDDAELIVSP
jgi:alkylation response protein AidB-like acyl-CoA dehydrogenase